ncbi:MAG: 30S ribosomal protein S14 [Chlamydiae bacterium]|nr:30S ribosomal protein S14 [Chlamydiota bacterium]
MAKQSMVQKQLKRAKMVSKYWERRQKLKAIISNVETNEEDRLEAINALNKLPRDSSRVRSRNRCQLTGRPRGYLRKFKLSRICFREMANTGLVPGVVKASW